MWWDEDDMVLTGAQEETATAGMRVKRERRQSRSAVGADCWTVGALSGIGLPGGVPPTNPRGELNTVFEYNYSIILFNNFYDVAGSTKNIEQ